MNAVRRSFSGFEYRARRNYRYAEPVDTLSVLDRTLPFSGFYRRQPERSGMTDVLVPGGRDVRGTLDEPGGDGEPAAIVVACPPHPQHGGSRSDRRLTAVSEAVTDAGVACLRFDYGPWDGGEGERADVRNAIRWASEETDRVGVFGYSFGAVQALLASADAAVSVSAVSVLAPPARLGPELDAVAAYDRLDCPVHVCYGERDTTVDWEPIVDRARERSDEVVTVSADHFFVTQDGTIGDAVGDFFERTLLDAA